MLDELAEWFSDNKLVILLLTILIFTIILMIWVFSHLESNYYEYTPSIRFSGNQLCINNGTMWYSYNVGKSTYTDNQYFNKTMLKQIVAIYDKLHSDTLKVC